MSTQTKYSYNYDSDQLISEKEECFTIRFGKVIDTMTTNTNYIYYREGLLKKEISKTDFEEKPSLRIYDYDSNDSLILKLTINTRGDTTSWDVYKYFLDGRKIVFERKIIPSYYNNPDLIEDLSNHSLDTMQYQYDYHYEDNFCNSLKQYDSKNNLTKTIKFNYQNGKLIKETHVTYSNSKELLEKTKNYDYSKSEDKPDFYSLDSRNDTIEMSVNEFDKDLLLSTIQLYDYGNLIYKTLFENGKEIRMISLDKKMNNRGVDLYKYSENGDLKEVLTHNEEINAH